MARIRGVLEEIEELTIADPRIVLIGSDLGAGMFSRLKRAAPDRFFMEGVSEQHLVGMAAGLALEGFRPIVMTIATFLTRRCLEQIIVDAALHELPVCLLGTGGGLAYVALGPTHISVDDFALLRAVPGMTVLAPAETCEANALLAQAMVHSGPVYLRLPRGNEELMENLSTSVIGRSVVLREPGRVLLVGTGQMTATAIEVADALHALGISAGVLHMHTLQPLDRATLADLARVELVLTIEEHLRSGGLGSAVLEALHDARVSPMPVVSRHGVPDRFVSGYGSRGDQLARFGLTAEALTQVVVEFLNEGLLNGGPEPLHEPAASTIPAGTVAHSRG